MPERSEDQEIELSSPQQSSLPIGLLPCFYCGYDLRGSPSAGQCPECGHAYRWESLYTDIAHQKLRNVLDDVNFVFLAALIIVVSCIILLVLNAITSSPTHSTAFMVLFQSYVILGFFYLMAVFLYVYCWLKVLYQINWDGTLLWGQAKGVGLDRAFIRAGIGLAGPVVVIALIL